MRYISGVTIFCAVMFVFWPWVLFFIDVCWWIFTSHTSGIITYSDAKVAIMATYPIFFFYIILLTIT